MKDRKKTFTMVMNIIFLSFLIFLICVSVLHFFTTISLNKMALDFYREGYQDFEKFTDELCHSVCSDLGMTCSFVVEWENYFYCENETESFHRVYVSGLVKPKNSVPDKVNYSCVEMIYGDLNITQYVDDLNETTYDTFIPLFLEALEEEQIVKVIQRQPTVDAVMVNDSYLGMVLTLWYELEYEDIPPSASKEDMQKVKNEFEKMM